MFGVVKTELREGRATLKGAGRVGGKRGDQEGCHSQPSNGNTTIVDINCAQRGCSQQAVHGVAAENAEFSGDHPSRGISSPALRPTKPSRHERARTASVDAQHDTGDTIPISDIALDTALPVLAAAAEGVIGSIHKGQTGWEPGGTKIWGSVRLKAAGQCCNPPCSRRSVKGCSCDESCTDKGGKGSGVLMCHRCFRYAFWHAQAAAAYFRDDFDWWPNRKPMRWLPVPDAVLEVAPPPAASANVAAGRTKKGAKAVWGSVKLKEARKCCNPHCSQRSAKGCSCDEFCTDEWGNGKGSGVLICLTCFRDRHSHEEAATAYFHGHHARVNRKPIKGLPQA